MLDLNANKEMYNIKNYFGILDFYKLVKLKKLLMTL